jgi:hypothetical protein
LIEHCTPSMQSTSQEVLLPHSTLHVAPLGQTKTSHGGHDVHPLGHLKPHAVPLHGEQAHEPPEDPEEPSLSMVPEAPEDVLFVSKRPS